MSANTEHRKLAAIMFTDMVGYSALAQRNEALALELLEEHRRLLRAIFPVNHGQEIETAGDAFMVEFASALDATRCAVEIQRTLTERNQDLPTDRHVRLRIGVHLGDVVHKDGKVMGDAVNIAARIEPLAEAGGICLSRPVVDQIANKIDAALVKLGTPELKNIQMPVEVYRVVLPGPPPSTSLQTAAGLRPLPSRRPQLAVVIGLVALLGGLGVWMGPRFLGAKPERIDSLAVLLVAEPGGKAQTNSLAAELTEELTTRLSRLGSFTKVISPSAMSRYRAPRVSPTDIMRELEVNALVEGEVRADGDRVSLDLHLIGAGQRRRWWSASFANALGDLDHLANEASLAVFRELNPAAALPPESRLLPETPARRQATQLYRQSRYLNYLGGLTNSLAAIQLMEQAVAVDDSFAKAWAALAIKYVEHFYVLDPAKQETWGSKAFAAADTALALDSRMAEVYVARAKLLWAPISGFQHEKALAELRKALELDWQSFPAHEFASVVCEHVGLLDEALVHARRAEELDPLSPYPMIDLAAPQLDAGNYATALRHWQRVPNSAAYQSYVGSHWAWTLFALGDTAGAKAKVEEYLLLARNDPAGEDKAGGLTAMKALLAAAAGDVDTAKQLIAVAEKKEDRYGEFHHTGYLIAAAYARLKQPAETLHWLKKTAVEGFPCYPLFAKDPNLDPVRVDPQIKAFLDEQADHYELRKTSWPKTTTAVDSSRGRR